MSRFAPSPSLILLAGLLPVLVGCGAAGGVGAAASSIGALAVIDTATRQVVATVPVGREPERVVVAKRTSDGRTLAFVSNALDDTVSVVDTSTRAVTATVPVGPFPRALAATGDGKTVYVFHLDPADSTRDIDSEILDVTDAAHPQVTSTMPTHGGTTAAAITASQHPVRIRNRLDGNGSYVDLESLPSSDPAAWVSLPMSPISNASGSKSGGGIAVDPATGKVFATWHRDPVSGTGTNGGAEVNELQIWPSRLAPSADAAIAVGKTPVAVALSASGSRKSVFAANIRDNTVSVVDVAVAQFPVVATIPVGQTPADVAASPTGDAVLVANSKSSSLSLIDSASNAVTATLSVPGRPLGIAFDPDPAKHLAYVTLADATLLPSNGGGGGGGNTTKKFASVNSVRIDSQGRIYVADVNNQRLVRVDDMTGKGAVVLTGSGSNKLGAPVDFFLGPDGKIYLLTNIDAGSGTDTRIVRVDDMTGAGWVTYGTFGHDDLPGHFDAPTAIWVDGFNRIYVVDYLNGRTVRFDDMNGSNWQEIGALGSAMRGVATDSQGHVYISTITDGLIRYNGMSRIGGVILPGIYGQLEKVWIDNNRAKLYTVDSIADRIIEVDRDDPFTNVKMFGTGGAGKNQFNAPIGVTTDSAGRIYIADQNAPRVVRIDDMTGAGWTELSTYTP